VGTPAVRRELDVKRWVANHDTATYLALTFGIAWPLWLVSGALTRTPVRAPDLSWLVAQVGVFAPALAGLAIGASVEPGGCRLGLSTVASVYVPATAIALRIATRGFSSFAAMDAVSTWAMVALGIWVLAWFGANRRRVVSWPEPKTSRAAVACWSVGCVLVPTAFFLVAWGLAGGAREGSSSLPAMPARSLTWFGVLSALAVNLSFGGALGEEPGWRGAWLPRLLRRHTPFGASVVISFWWALWHAPIDLSQGFGLQGAGAVLIRQVFTLPAAVLFTWVAVRAGGSLLPPLLLHATINAFPDFGMAQPGRYQSAMEAYFVVLLVAAVAVLAFDPTLRRAPRIAPES
jgi:membrane protease YdiL (CAAX protease family)